MLQPPNNMNQAAKGTWVAHLPPFRSPPFAHEISGDLDSFQLSLLFQILP